MGPLSPASFRGFTLIELSIVLVIIGLMVGAIVGGRALVHQAELQSVIKEANTLQTALNTFVMQYDALPGDFKEATSYWSAANNGNGNGSWRGNGTDETTEGFYAYDHLNRAEIFPNGLTGDAIGGRAVPGQNIHASKVKGGGWQFTGNLMFPFYGIYGQQAFIGLGAQPANPTWGWAEDGILLAKDAKSIDLKMDDGNPGTGKLLAFGGNDTPDPKAGKCTTKADIDTLPSAYVLSDTVYKCVLKVVWR